MRTALVRKHDGNLKILRFDGYRTNKEFETELRANGFRVLKVWSKNISDAEVEEWELLNRK